MLLDMSVTGPLLKKLREDKKKKAVKGWSQPDFAKKLNEYVDKTWDNENGKVTVSQLERGKRNITLEVALAYAEIFDVSLDYLCGRDSEPQPKHRNIKEDTLLSDNSIKQLLLIKNAIEDIDNVPGQPGYYFPLLIDTINLLLDIEREHDILLDIALYLRGDCEVKNPKEDGLLIGKGIMEYVYLQDISTGICSKLDASMAPMLLMNRIQEQLTLLRNELKERENNDNA